MPNLDFEKEQVGPRDGEGPRQQDRARRVHLRGVRTLPGELPGLGRGQGAEPEDADPADAGRAARGPARRRSSASSTRRRFSGSARRAAPARTSAPSASSTCRSSSARGAVWCRTATRRTIWAACTTTSSGAANIWGLSYDQRQKFVDSAALETFDPDEARRPRLARMRRRVRGRLPEVAAIAVRDPARARSVRFGVLSKERCTGDPAKRTGNEYMFQELAQREHRGPEGRRAEEDRHVVSALREDDRRRLPAVRLRGRDRALGGVRRGADAGPVGAAGTARGR